MYAADAVLEFPQSGERFEGVAVLEFRGELVCRETVYVTEAFPAPDWRAAWRAAPLADGGDLS